MSQLHSAPRFPPVALEEPPFGFELVRSKSYHQGSKQPDKVQHTFRITTPDHFIVAIADTLVVNYQHGFSFITVKGPHDYYQVQLVHRDDIVDLKGISKIENGHGFLQAAIHTLPEQVTSMVVWLT